MWKIPFHLYKVTESFNPTSSFSWVDLNLALHETHSAHVVIRAEWLFNLDKLEVNAENEKAVKFIKHCKSIAWSQYSSKPLAECSVMVDISRTLFVPLCEVDEVILENTYFTLLTWLGPATAGLKTSPIGYGSFETWHGSPDAQVRLYMEKWECTEICDLDSTEPK